MATIIKFPADEERFWKAITEGARLFCLRANGTSGGIEWAIERARERLQLLGFRFTIEISVSADDLATPEAFGQFLQSTVHRVCSPLLMALIHAELELFNALSDRHPRPEADDTAPRLTVIDGDKTKDDDPAGT